MKKWQILTGALALGLILALAAGLTQAQEPEQTEEQVSPEGEVEAATITPGAIPIQGRLTNSIGNPLADGSYTVTFSLYESQTGGSAICADTNVVTVADGLFSSYMDYCYDDLYGQKVWLGITVEGDAEMTPRQVIYAVPYALGLKPGAVISDTRDVVLKVQSTGSGDSDAFIADARGTGEAVEAYARDGIGVFAKSDTYLALQAYSYDHTDHPGVFGCSAASASVCDPYRDDGPAGVMGYGPFGVYGIGTSLGVFGEVGSSFGFGGYFHHTAGGLALVADSSAAANDDIVRFRNNFDVKFKVQGDGDVYIDGSFYDTGADLAEMLPAQEGLEPGDVLIIGTDGQLTRSTAPYQTAVVGVYSTRPGFVGGASEDDDLTGKVPLAIVGVVPVKASAENGAVRPGDLLVTSSAPGHAMRAGDNPPQGTVLGKALGALEEGSGVIDILVTLQ
jgi:hypothetical protein